MQFYKICSENFAFYDTKTTIYIWLSLIYSHME